MDGAKQVTDPVMEQTNKAGAALVEGSESLSNQMIDGANSGTDMLDTSTKFTIGSVTESFDSLGAVAGFQTMIGGMFGAVDKSDAALEKMFKEMDADGSGKVSEDEMKAAIQKVYGEALKDDMLKEMMKAADTNND